MHHGFAAARANLQDPANRESFDKAIELTIKFFDKNVVARSTDNVYIDATLT